MEISAEQARAQWFLRNGNGNPERVEYQFWIYMIRSRHDAWWARDKFKVGGHPGSGLTNKRYSNPVWSFSRFGRTVTQLKDGEIVYVAGEHEDSGDCDFCIYSDVVVEGTSGELDVYLYPDDIFPPTDFHSATLVGQSLILIGNLGYRSERRPGETQVLKLDLEFLSITPLDTSGDNPGWVSRHEAAYLRHENAIEVWGGQTLVAGAGPGDFTPLVGIYRLDLTTLEWSRTD